MASSSNDRCTLCKDVFQTPPTTVQKKGYETMLRICIEHDMQDLANDLKEKFINGCPILVHFDCRRKFTDTRKKSQSKIPPKRLRSSMDNTFNWKEHCFLCNTKVDIRHTEKGSIVKVMTLPLRVTLITCAEERGDEWGDAVRGRLENCNDLVAEEAIYHSTCMAKFRLKRISQKTRGKPVDSNLLNIFENVCDWLEREGDCELHTITELQNKMKIFSDGEAYSTVYIKKKIKEKYNDHVYFSEIKGQSDVVCFREMANYILKEKKKNSNESKEDVIIAAAKIIKADIRELSKSNETYPTTDDISKYEEGMNWISESLKLLLSYLIPSELKQMAIGQCIMQAAKPRSILCPLPFGLGVELERSFGSKWLLNHLAKLGFTVSADEVLRFKQSAIKHSKELENHKSFRLEEASFAQWSADNVDHNIVTLTGKGTFHGMGVISMTSWNEDRKRNHVISRLKRKTLQNNSLTQYGIPIHNYLGSSKKGHSMLRLKPIMQLKTPYVLPTEWNYDFLWHSLRFLKTSSELLPNWSGFMQDITSETERKSKASIDFLPIIDMNPTDENCIYSTLLFIINEAKKLNILVPCVTFDQPLWLKAVGIIAEADLKMIARLGGFHTLMSFLGSVGKMMRGSGIEELFAVVYAENSAEHMMSGKAVSRALRAHFLIEAALKCILFDIVKEKYGIEDESLKNTIEYIQTEKDLNKIDNILESKPIADIKNAFEEVENELSSKSRTAKLWLLYLHYIGVLKQFIFAERTSNWLMHLKSSTDMLNLFASTGHYNYAKSARLYIQQMRSLEKEYPWLSEKFLEGDHAVKRSSGTWNGLWSDLVIEQTMMRSIKSRGGLTTGRGMTESVRHMWVLSLNYSAAIHDAMTELTGVSTKTSEQHVDIGTTRCTRDNEDFMKFKCWLEERNPFTYKDEHLHSLSTGIISVIDKDNVNCEKAEDLGAVIQQDLDNSSISAVKISRKNQIRPLDTIRNTVKVDDVEVYVNATILFTRLAAVAKREDDEEKYFDYELTTEPMALFKNGLMRKPDKAALRKALMKDEDVINNIEINNDHIFVVDGGALLHRVCWIKGMTFSEIGTLYVNYVTKHYGDATVVFDGYEDATTKSSEHKRRTGNGPKCPDIEVVESNKVHFPQERLLSNPHNKTEIIALISTYLRNNDITVINCAGDADTEIVSTALEYSTNTDDRRVIVVADDTDIAVMLLYHWKETMMDIIFYQQRMNRGWSMKTVSPSINTIKDHLLFIHAMSGCDTTSAAFGKGKVGFLNLVKKSETLKDLSDTMNDVWADKNEIGMASITTFTLVYGGKLCDTLTKMRYVGDNTVYFVVN